MTSASAILASAVGGMAQAPELKGRTENTKLSANIMHVGSASALMERTLVRNAREVAVVLLARYRTSGRM
eukprot:3989697-Pyramimonas_sp.AAC.1